MDNLARHVFRLSIIPSEFLNEIPQAIRLPFLVCLDDLVVRPVDEPAMIRTEPLWDITDFYS